MQRPFAQDIHTRPGPPSCLLARGPGRRKAEGKRQTPKPGADAVVGEAAGIMVPVRDTVVVVVNGQNPRGRRPLWVCLLQWRFGA